MGTSIEERIAVLETKAEMQEEYLRDIAGKVSELHSRFTTSKGMVAGAMAVLGAVVGVIGFFFKQLLEFVTHPFGTIPPS